MSDYDVDAATITSSAAPSGNNRPPKDLPRVKIPSNGGDPIRIISECVRQNSDGACRTFPDAGWENVLHCFPGNRRSYYIPPEVTFDHGGKNTPPAFTVSIGNVVTEYPTLMIFVSGFRRKAANACADVIDHFQVPDTPEAVEAFCDENQCGDYDLNDLMPIVDYYYSDMLPGSVDLYNALVSTTYVDDYHSIDPFRYEVEIVVPPLETFTAEIRVDGYYEWTSEVTDSGFFTLPDSEEVFVGQSEGSMNSFSEETPEDVLRRLASIARFHEEVYGDDDDGDGASDYENYPYDNFCSYFDPAAMTIPQFSRYSFGTMTYPW